MSVLFPDIRLPRRVFHAVSGADLFHLPLCELPSIIYSCCTFRVADQQLLFCGELPRDGPLVLWRLHRTPAKPQIPPYTAEPVHKPPEVCVYLPGPFAVNGSVLICVFLAYDSVVLSACVYAVFVYSSA